MDNLKAVKSIIKNVSSSKYISQTPSLRKFKKSLPGTFIYESILIKIYVNANIMNTQIFHLIKYDLSGHLRSQYVIFTFILNLTYVLIDNFCPCFV